MKQVINAISTVAQTMLDTTNAIDKALKYLATAMLKALEKVLESCI